MIARRFSLLTALLSLACWQGAVRAEALRIQVPDDSKFVVHVDVPAVKKSAVGSRTLARAKEKLLADMQDDGLDLEKIKEIVGFDPFEEVQAIVVAGSDYEAPEKSVVACVRLRETVGNLEGLLLGLPGYEVEDVDGVSLHSARPEGDMTVYCAFHKSDDGNHTVVIAASREAVLAVLGAIGGDASDDDSKTVTIGADGAPLAAVDVFELPAELAKSDGPQANVAKIVRSASVRVSEKGDAVNIAVSITAAADKQAEQLEQAARGLGAMIGLAAANDPDDEDLQMIKQLLTGLQVQREGATVETILSVPTEQVMSLLEENVFDD